MRFSIHKQDIREPAFKKVGAGISVRAGVEFDFAGQTLVIAADTPISLPSLTAGTDYRIAIKADNSFQAYTYSDTLPDGAAVVGGFHYLPGGYPTSLGQGGDWNPTLLEWSIWDLNFRPSCADPRGMTRIGHSGVWIDIYFQGNSSIADGVSRNNDTILTGGNPPVIPADFGGNGTARYTTMNWWEANEHLRQWGKRMPTYAEMSVAAFGTNEKAGRGAHPVKTGLNTANWGTSSDPNFTSKFGLIQATGVLWIWTADLSDWQGTPTTNTWGWQAYDVTGGRGKAILQNDADLTSLLFGASWVYQLTTSPTGVAGVAGSRSVETIETLWDNSENIAMRGACNSYIRY
ncbi:hypothetical protein ACIPEN_05780 [Herbaspirillum chlorophenolicum]|uniref:Major tropism determinant second domain-containing protein n=1 Tax=Herbaspirillum chlorophenolicum TaxID=211589 RepID=A0ABW8EVI5_9BURK